MYNKQYNLIDFRFSTGSRKIVRKHTFSFLLKLGSFLLIKSENAMHCQRISHAREPLYSNSAVIAWCSQSTGAQNILFLFTVIHSMSQYFTAFNFHDVFFIRNYCLGIVIHSGPIRAFNL